jgi:acetyl-CoA carboxylase biotin carboxyl carrier protein
MADITALMAGTVNEVKVKENDAVNAGDEVMIIESMKMLIPLPSQSAGTVKEIKAQVGQFVNQGDVLIVLE